MSRPAAAVVDPYTSGAGLPAALRRAGYDSIAVTSSRELPDVFRNDTGLADADRVVGHAGDVAATAARLREAGVSFVIAGCELGVELADALAAALGLPANDPRTRRARRDKGRMAEAFRAAGLPAPRQHCADRLPPLLAWLRGQRRWPVVVKPAESSSSDGVALCADEEAVERAFHAIIGHTNVLGLTNRRVVVQEFLRGTEYVVDSASCDGHHRPVACWRYRKPDPTPSFTGYDAMDLLPGEGELFERLAAAAERVLDALGIRYGAGHSELVATDAGLVPLEVGARMHGGENPRLAALCGARSHLDETLRAYVDPRGFRADRAAGYALDRHCTVAFLMPRASGRLRGLPRRAELEALPSLHELVIADCVGEPVPAVIGWAALIDPQRDAVERDLAALRRLEAEGLYQLDPA